MTVNVVGWSSLTLIVGLGVEKLNPDVVNVGLISVDVGVCGDGESNVTWLGWIVNGWFIPFSSSTKVHCSSCWW